jgi:hypothetical protein
MAGKFFLSLLSFLAGLIAVLGTIAAILLGKKEPLKPLPAKPIDLSADLDLSRRKEEKRIQEEIKSESDAELVSRFNRLANRENKKKEEG